MARDLSGAPLAGPVRPLAAIAAAALFLAASAQAGPPRERVVYRDALDRLAAGSAAEAAAALDAFERQTELGALATSPGEVERGVVEVLDGIARSEPEALLPAILLHVERFRTHRAAGASLLVNHHAAMIGRAAALYAAHAAAPEARRTAAEPLAAVGLALVEDRRPLALEALGQALALDPDNPTALLALAFDRERQGEYREAVAALERLMAAGSASAEARLRLAVNLRRTGKRRAAAEHLAAVIGDPGADWTAEIAYQELAASKLEASDAAAAVALLREARERFPGSGRLRLQLAYALDRAGDPAAARRAITELDADTGGDPGETARVRYSRCPEAAPLLAMNGLRHRADERLQALASALGRLEGGR